MNNIKYILANITWNSNDWKGISNDPSNHRYVREGNIAHESWNFDFDNERNIEGKIYGFAQFKHSPQVSGNNNLIVFYSNQKIVGFYGKAEVLTEKKQLNENESYNIIGKRDYCVLLKNKIDKVKEKGYLENKERIGQIGFNYIERYETVKSILLEAIKLNNEDKQILLKIMNWVMEENNISKKYWIYAPGEGASEWEDFYENGVMGLGWNEIGDLNNYETKDDIVKKLQEIYSTDSSKKNGALACWDFKFTLNIGDIVFAKKGRSLLLGYGIVTSDYYYDEEVESYKKRRKMEWKKKGEWKPDFDLPLKTLTDISDNKENIDKLMKIMNLKEKNKTEKEPLNQILYGPPGTGKTYHTIDKSVEIVDREFYNTLENKENRRDELKNKFRELMFDPETEKGQIAFITFHQSYSYEEFIEGIKPQLNDDIESGDGNSRQLNYEFAQGIFRKICKAAQKGGNFTEKIEWLKKETSTADDKNPIEIDTGSSKFELYYKGGKTFTVKPEQSKRKENEYPASIEAIRKIYEGGSRREVYNPTYVVGILKYLYKNGLSKTEDNNNKPYVLIIDEINRGNVSQIFGELITLIEEDKRLGNDEWLEITLPYSKESFGVPSNLYIIGTMNTADRSVEALDTALRRRFSFEEMKPNEKLINSEFKVGDYSLSKILETINKRIEVLLDKDHRIGHSYFMFKDKDDIVSKTREAFNKNIIPLLQEYFYGDYGKIGLVLGEGFIDKIKVKDNKYTDFAKFDYDDIAELLDSKIIYEIKYHDNNDKFKEAIKQLINNPNKPDAE